MIVSGVDLSTDPRKTAIAGLEWSTEGVCLVELREPAGEDDIVAAVAESDLTGIDAPLGWPAPFVDFLAAHIVAHPTDLSSRSPGWREEFALRRTDLHARRLGARPLSVSSNLIGMTALYAARILERVELAGLDIARDGSSGRIIEVYPALSLHLWGFPRTYRSDLGAAVAVLESTTPRIDLGPFHAQLTASDHAFDALIAALTALAERAGATVPIPEDDKEAARTEGWIAAPSGTLAELSRRAP